MYSNQFTVEIVHGPSRQRNPTSVGFTKLNLLTTITLPKFFLLKLVWHKG